MAVTLALTCALPISRLISHARLPTQAEPLFLEGNRRMQAGDTEGAEECFRQAVALNSDFTEALANLGLMRERAGAVLSHAHGTGRQLFQGPIQFGLCAVAPGTIRGRLALHGGARAVRPVGQSFHPGIQACAFSANCPERAGLPSLLPWSRRSRRG
jgi:hypothetical protein